MSTKFEQVRTNELCKAESRYKEISIIIIISKPNIYYYLLKNFV